MLKLHKFHYILSGGVCALAILLTIFYCSTIPIAHADSNISLSVDNSDVVLELTVPSSATLNLAPSSANGGISYSERNIDVSAGTNNIAGYTLTMRANSSALTRTNGITDGSGATSTPTIPSVSGSYALNDYHTAQATVNTWACALPNLEDSNATLSYTSVPTTDTRIAFTRAAGNANTTTVSFTAKVDSSLPAGNYATTLNFVAVANVPPIFNGITTMQEMTPQICSAAAENDTIQLEDTRDNKLYWVSKLKDGNCWMAQNLDYDIKASGNEVAVIGGTTTTWNSSYPPHATETTLSSHLNDTDTYSWDPGDYYVENGGGASACSTWRPTSDCQSTKATVSLTSADAKDNTNLHYHLGNYYQWNTATAGYGGTETDGDITQSICPKGWRLPTGSSYTDNYSFGALTNAYGITNSANGTTDAVLLSSPLWFVRAGYVGKGSLSDQGTYGLVWSSRAHSYLGGAYVLRFYSTDVSPSSGGDRDYGYSVRCVAE